MPKKSTKNKLEEEKLAIIESEAMASGSSEPSYQADLVDEQAEKALMTEKELDADEVTPVEVAAIHTEKETVAPSKSPSKKARSKRYQEARAHLEAGKLYLAEEAIELVKKMSVSKYDGSLELHLKLQRKKAKGASESTKGILHLPNGTGKEKKIAVLTEEMIEEIAKTKKITFDVALASPALMPKVAKIAKILGPKGKMPDPKSGTVTDKPEEVIKEINSGKVEYRIDAGNNVHQIVGRVSWNTAKLLENVTAVFSVFPKNRIEVAYLTASVAPSVPLNLSYLK